MATEGFIRTVEKEGAAVAAAASSGVRVRVRRLLDMSVFTAKAQTVLLAMDEVAQSVSDSFLV